MAVERTTPGGTPSEAMLQSFISLSSLIGWWTSEIVRVRLKYVRRYEKYEVGVAAVSGGRSSHTDGEMPTRV